MSNTLKFSKSNLRGSLILLGIIAIVFVLPDLIRYYSNEEIISFQSLTSEEKEAIKKLKHKERRNYSFRGETSRYVVPPEKFNPDDYSVEQWMFLGLSRKQANVLVKWHINSNEDLKNVFVVNDELYNLIKDSTFYTPKFKQESKYKQEETPRLQKRVDLNSASMEELMEIKGVGEYFAKQIMWKREKFGGFVSFDQLKDIKHVDDEKLETWKTQAFLNEKHLKKININTATAEEFKAHPYISWNLANSLVKLRSQVGHYSKVEDVRKSVLMTDDLYEKLKYYLVVE